MQEKVLSFRCRCGRYYSDEKGGECPSCGREATDISPRITLKCLVCEAPIGITHNGRRLPKCSVCGANQEKEWERRNHRGTAPLLILAGILGAIAWFLTSVVV